MNYLRKLRKWWVKCGTVVGHAITVSYVKKYLFVLNKFQNQDLTHKFLNNLWRVYNDTNEYNFEIEHVFVNHDSKKKKKRLCK